jgi:hypothetical protein
MGRPTPAMLAWITTEGDAFGPLGEAGKLWLPTVASI